MNEIYYESCVEVSVDSIKAIVKMKVLVEN